MTALAWWLAAVIALPSVVSAALSVRRTLRRQRALTEHVRRVEAARLAEARARHQGREVIR